LSDYASIGIGVLGAGRIGVLHAKNVARNVPGAHLVGVADVDDAATHRVVRTAGQGRAFDVDSLLGDRAVQGVIIATPTATHADFVARAAREKKDVFCEKPISLRLDETRRAIAAADRANVILQVGFQRRFDADFAAAKAAVARGALGEVRFVRLVGRDHHIPSLAYLRTSGGQFRDQMIHEFDTARWLLEPSDVVEVYATGSALIERALDEFDDVDTSVACLRSSSGALLTIDGSRETAYGYDARGEIHGSSAMLLVGQERFAGRAMLDKSAAAPDVESFLERFAQAYRDEIVDFVAAIRERRTPRVGGVDSLEALRVALAADRSRRERRPIRVADVTDD
jgi:myo-inositol 2-dehydrogenase/D-chiro-inositol 1-dehydrogenase